MKMTNFRQYIDQFILILGISRLTTDKYHYYEDILRIGVNTGDNQPFSNSIPQNL